MKLYLASTSPRRRQLLEEVGFHFSVIQPNIEEIERRGESPRSMVRRFSQEKASAVANQLLLSGVRSAVILAADTTVVSPQKKILNKPTHSKHAETMLRSLVGKTHTVYTAYSLVEMVNGKTQPALTRVVATQVRMRRLDSEAIRAYVQSKEPLDKAGSYGAQGIGMHLIERLVGSYTNVVGLPMCEVVEDLEKRFAIYPKWRKKKL